MKHGIFATVLALSLLTPVESLWAQSRPANMSLGSVTLSKKVTANGQQLSPGTYQLRLTAEEPPKPGVGQTPEAERYVEFVRAGRVIAKEVATVVTDADVKTIVKGPQPARGGVRVDTLKGDDYVRVWVNRGGNNYIIHLPAGA